MKFIRDIIAERSDIKATESTEAPTASEVEPDPKPQARRPDRTMTRLSDGAMLGADDVFKRLLSENDGSETDHSDQVETSFFADDEMEQPAESAELDDDTNLFDDLASETAKTEDEVDFEKDVPDLMAPVAETLSDAHSETDADPAPAPETQATDAVPDAAPLPKDVAPASRIEPEGVVPTIDTPPAPEMIAVPAPASGRSGRGAGRVKTRLLGFGMPEAPVHDPFAKTNPSDATAVAQTTFPVGWLVVTTGPGRGTSFALHDGVSQIGRGDDQAIRLDFGDTSISRTNHAAIAYDSEQGGFFLGHGGKANMVRLNDRPVLSTEEISSGAIIRIGETTLRFIAFCDGDFSWAEEGL